MGNQHSSPRQRAAVEPLGEPWTYPRAGQHQQQRAWRPAQQQQQHHQHNHQHNQSAPVNDGPASQAAYDQFERECVQYEQQQPKLADEQLKFAMYGRHGPRTAVQQAKKIKVLPTTVNGTPANGVASSAAVVKLRPTDNGLALHTVGTLHLPNRKPTEVPLDVKAHEEARSPTPDYDAKRPSRSRSKSRKSKTPTAPSTPKSSVGRGDGPASKSGSGRGKLRLFKTKSDARSEERVRARSLEYLRADARDETQERRHSSREELSGDDSPLALARSGPITVFSSQKKLDDAADAADADDWEHMPHRAGLSSFYFGASPADVAVTKAPRATHAHDAVDLDEESRRVMEEFDAVLAVDDRSEAGRTEPDEEGDDIALSLRPTLPKKPQQLPRFSPSAAWRALGAGHQAPPDAYLRPAKLNASSSKASDASAMELSEEDEDDDVTEERISRDALRPVAPHQPRISNEKSADSGISGDAGSPDAGAMAKPLAMSSPVPRPGANWTPQQDLLDDDDSSSAGDHEQRHQLDATPPKIMPKSQMFQDSTDAGSRSSSVSKGRKFRKRHEQPDQEHGPQKYNSLRKLKRSVSGAFASAFRRAKSTDDEEDDESGPVHDDGNWVLSRSAPNSIVNGSVDGHRGSKFRSEADLLGLASPALGQQYPAYSQPAVFNQRIVYLPQYDSRKTQQQQQQQSGPRPDRSEMIRRARSADAVFHEAKTQQLSAAQRLFGAGQRKFTFQSTVRLQERRMLEERLSREAETKERKRLQEVQAMQRVEEEFQRKRAREKANIRQQLRVMQLDGDERSARMDPEGAPSSLSSSHRRTSSDEAHRQQYRAVVSAMNSRLKDKREPLNQSDYRRQVINQSKLRSAAPPSPSTAAAALEARVNAERASLKNNNNNNNNNNVHKKSTSSIYRKLAEIASEEESIAPPPPVPVLVSRKPQPQRPPSSGAGNNKVMTQELSEYRQERREYRDFRSPRPHQPQQMAPGRYYAAPSSGQRIAPAPGGVAAPAKVQSDNYRWDFAHGGRHQSGKMVQPAPGWHHHHHHPGVVVRTVHHDYQPAYYKMTSPSDVIVMHRTPQQRHYY